MKLSVKFSSVTQSCPTLCNPMSRSTPGLPVHHQPPEFTQTLVHRVSDANQPSHPLSSPSPPALIPPSIRVFSNESTLHMRWPKYWSFSFSIKLESRLLGEISITSDMQRRRQWQPTPVLLPGKSHGWRSLVGYSPWGRKESDTTERLPFPMYYLLILLAVILQRAELFILLKLSLSNCFLLWLMFFVSCVRNFLCNLW